MIDICIDEDGIVNVGKFESVIEWNEKLENDFGFSFSDVSWSVVEDFDVEGDKDIFEFEGGGFELEKYNSIVNEVRELKKKNNNLIMVSYSIEYDVSYLVVDEKEFKDLKKVYKKGRVEI